MAGGWVLGLVAPLSDTLAVFRHFCAKKFSRISLSIEKLFWTKKFRTNEQICSGKKIFVKDLLVRIKS